MPIELGGRKFPYQVETGYINRFAWEVLPDGAWRGKPCYVIGGGPSLRYFDWSLLKGKRTIATNRAFEKFEPSIIFSMDTRYLRWILGNRYGVEARQRFEMTAAYKIWLCTYYCKLPPNIYIVKTWKSYQHGFRAFPQTMRDGIGHGNNTGYAALNLAVCLGANPIYLLGFDMKHDGLRSHWHPGHVLPQKRQTVEDFIKYFQLAAVKSKEYGVRVINCNPDSALPWFETRPLKEVLH